MKQSRHHIKLENHSVSTSHRTNIKIQPSSKWNQLQSNECNRHSTPQSHQIHGKN